MTDEGMRQAVSDVAAVVAAADALRHHEMSGRTLNPWDRISGAQQRRWCKKARVVLDAYRSAGCNPA